MKIKRVPLVAVIILSLGIAGFIGYAIAYRQLPPPSIDTPDSQQFPVLVFQLSDLLDDSHYWNSSWDGDTLYQTLISINRLYHKNHAYIKGVFDCDDMAIDIWNILYKQGVTSVIGVGNLELDQEKFTQVDHAWLIVMYKDMYKDAGWYIFILEPTNGETYAFDFRTKAFSPYLQGYFFASPSDFEWIR